MLKYFRLSTRCRSSLELEQMFQFLSGKGIPCCIVKRGYQEFYLFRGGKEHTLHGVMKGYEHLNGEVVRTYDPNGIFN